VASPVESPTTEHPVAASRCPAGSAEETRRSVSLVIFG